MFHRTHFPSTQAEIRNTLDRASTTARANFHRLRDTATQALNRVATHAERQVSAAIERRVRPSIAATTILAGIALGFALIAVFRK